MPEKILIVDDDIDSLKLIGLMLQRHGYEVLAANSGSQAVTKAAAEHPDLVILDVMMPDMNGLEVCRRLRTNTETEGIPIIMFTAKTMIDDKVKGFEAGADDYLTKPTHPAELASRVKAILSRSAAKQLNQQSEQRGVTIGVLGAKGGVGATSVVLNLGAALQKADQHPVLVDFRLGMGSLGLMMGFPRTQSMARLMTRPLNELDQKLVSNEITTHQSGLRAILASVRPKESQIDFKIENAYRVIELVRSITRTSIYDLGSGITNNIEKLLQQMDRVILVVEPNSATLNIAREMIAEIEEQGGTSHISVVVVNRTQSSVQTPWPEVEKTLNRDLRAIIPSAPELAFQAVENAMPMIMLQPGSIVASQFNKLAEGIMQLV